MLSPQFSFDTRSSLIDRASNEVFDALIIGGGITGAAVARDAAYRGLSTLLVENGDFASGTSSGSSKLIHGGLRYLEQFEFKLVFEAIREREKLKNLYAPFVQDLRFVFPTYKNIYPPQWKLNLGLFLYDSFSGFRALHQSASAQKCGEQFPWLKQDSLTGACIYKDSFSEDYRLVIELIKSAHRKNASAISRMRVKGISPGAPHEVLLEDLMNPGTEIKVRAKFVFNCSGPFTDRIRALLKLPPALALTQGVHFCVPRNRLPIDTAFVLPDHELHRIVFAIPWNSITYLGTTDTEIEDPGKARATPADAEYILKIANRFFSSKLTRSDFIQSWAAVRPLLRPPESKKPSAISREHHLEENPKGIFHLMGGKLTSHRLMASEALDHIRKDHLVQNIPLQDQIWEKADPSVLEKTFGRFYSDILELDASRKLSQQKLKGSHTHLESEVIYAIHHEMALRPIDFIRRRSSIYYEEPSIEVARSVTDIFAKEMKWSEESATNCLNEIERQFEWDQKGF